MYGEASFKEEKCMISPRSNQLEESIRLVKEQQFENHLLDLTVMADRSEKGSGLSIWKGRSCLKEYCICEGVHNFTNRISDISYLEP